MFACVSLILFAAFFGNDALKYQTKNGALPPREECGIEIESTNKFPWMAYVPAESRMYNPDADIRCAGSLISKRYVILNKACLQFDLSKSKVRLGLDETAKENGVLKLNIEEKVIDEKYDFILLRLSEDVAFSDKIRPICLPFEEFEKPSPGDNVYTSGWGLTAYEGPPSKIKKYVKGTIEKNCVPLHNLVAKDSMCVTAKPNSVDKPCNGDEGSPIMYNDKGSWVMQGILINVFDSTNKPCAIKDAALGTKITEDALQWIIDKVH